MILSKHETGQLSEHFARVEFSTSRLAVVSGIDNTPPPSAWENLEALAREVLEPARSMVGPLKITSGYRCDELNRLVHGAPTSHHLCLEGFAAADVIPLQAGLGELVRSFAFSLIPFDQVIYEFGAWVHVSYNRTGENRRQLLEAFRESYGTRYARIDGARLTLLA